MLEQREDVMVWRAARFVQGALLVLALAATPAVLAQTSVPEPGKSKKIETPLASMWIEQSL